MYNLGFVATEFLKDTATQLTYFGLDLLLDSIPSDTLCVLFRNNHVIAITAYRLDVLYSFSTHSSPPSIDILHWVSTCWSPTLVWSLSARLFGKA